MVLVESTIKSLTDIQGFIRIITFHEEGSEHLLEAIETSNYI